MTNRFARVWLAALLLAGMAQGQTKPQSSFTCFGAVLKDDSGKTMCCIAGPSGNFEGKCKKAWDRKQASKPKPPERHPWDSRTTISPPEPLDVPPVVESCVCGSDSQKYCGDKERKKAPWNGQIGHCSLPDELVTCADKKRILLRDESGKGHCVSLKALENR